MASNSVLLKSLDSLDTNPREVVDPVRPHEEMKAGPSEKHAPKKGKKVMIYQLKGVCRGDTVDVVYPGTFYRTPVVSVVRLIVTSR